MRFAGKLRTALCFSLLALHSWGANPAVKAIADRMPTNDAKAAIAAYTELLALGQAGLADACAQIIPPGSGDDTKVRFLLSGVAFHVSRPGAGKERDLYATVLREALAKATNRELKAFFIRQLRWCGGAKDLAPLSSYLNDPTLHEAALFTLMTTKAPGTVEALHTALKAADAKTAATLVKALGELQHKPAVADITKWAKADQPGLCRNACWALANIGDAGSTALLKARISNDSHYERTLAAADYLLLARRLGEAGSKDSAAGICREIIAFDAKRLPAATACKAVSFLTDCLGPKALPDLFTALDSDRRGLGAVAATRLATLEGKAVTDALLTRLKTVAPAQKAAIIDVLGKRGAATALSAIKAALGDDDGAVRAAAIGACAELGTDPAISALIAMAGDEKEDVAAAVNAALARTRGKQTSGQVAAALAGATPPAKSVLLRVLAHRRDAGQADAVLPLIQDADKGVRGEALKAMGAVGSERHLPKLLQTALNGEGRDRSSAAAAYVAIGKRIADSAQRTDGLRAAFGSADNTQKKTLLGAMAKLCGPKSLEVAIAASKDADSAVKDMAVRALAGWGDAGAIDALLAIAKDSQNLPHRVLATRGAVSLIGRSGLGAAQKVTKLQQAFTGAPRPDEKKLALGELGKVRHDDAIKLAESSLGVAELKEEAAAAIVKIVCPQHKRDKGLKTPLAYSALAKAAKTIKNEDLKKAAAEHLLSRPIDTSGNLAKGKPVKTSCPQQANHSPDHAVDGKLDRSTGWWGAKWPSWLQVDLGKPIKIDTVRVIFYWDGRRLYQYTIDVSTDEKTWTKVADNSKNATPANENGLVHRFKPIDARYVRVNVIKNMVNEAVHILEVEAYEAGKAPKKFKAAPKPKPKAPAKPTAPPLSAPDKDGFISLFNGKDLSGWFGSTKGYEAKDGVLICKKKGGGRLLHTHEFGDFILHFDFNLEKGANNGLAVRTPQSGNPAYDGMELQIIDNVNYHAVHKYKLEPWQTHGSIYGVVPAKTGALKPPGEWNHQEVRALGRKITVILNGTTIVDADLSKIKETADKKGLEKHPGLLRDKGYIGFLGHGAHVEFKNIRIKPFAPYTRGPHNVPPEGFLPLFNGKDLVGWKGLVSNPEKRAKMEPEKLKEAEAKATVEALKHWRVIDETIEYDGKHRSLCTAKDYADFEMYVDWKIPAGGDSGIYLRGSPQVQIWDPSRHPEGSGAFYNNKKNPRIPLVCADNPIGEWNRFRILMIGEKVTIWLNGIKVVDNTVMENYWNRSKPIYPSEQIELQHHGSKLWFRNIFIREIKK